MPLMYFSAVRHASPLRSGQRVLLPFFLIASRVSLAPNSSLWEQSGSPLSGVAGGGGHALFSHRSVNRSLSMARELSVGDLM